MSAGAILLVQCGASPESVVTSGCADIDRAERSLSDITLRQRTYAEGAIPGRDTVDRAIPHLPADDLRIAREFYVTKLGFQVAYEASEDGKGGILGLKRGGMQIIVDSPMEGHGRNACVSLEVEDADAYFNEWSTSVVVLRPPRNEVWGARTFDLLDLFGNTLFVMGPIR